MNGNVIAEFAFVAKAFVCAESMNMKNMMMTKTPEQYEAEIKVLVDALECAAAHDPLKECIKGEAPPEGSTHCGYVSLRAERALSTYKAQAEVWRKEKRVWKALKRTYGKGFILPGHECVTELALALIDLYGDSLWKKEAVEEVL